MFSKCIICRSSDLKQILYQEHVPVSVSRLKEDLEGILDIVSCNKCSHIFNRGFDPAIIEKVYNNEEYSACLPVTPSIITRLKNIAENIIGNKNIANKLVIEVGAMDFTFSEILLEFGAREVIAIEPSTRFTTANPKIKHIRDYLTDEDMRKYFPNADLIVYRHVFEHLMNPLEILESTIKNMYIGSKLYIEVPNVDDILEKKRVYDFFYEHISYFSPRLFEFIQKKMGCSVLLTEMLVDGQHFGILSQKVKELPNMKVNFENINIRRDKEIESFKASVNNFDKEIMGIVSSNKNVAIYGAGGHAVSVTTRLRLDPKRIKYMYDLSPIKQGTLSPLCNISIVKPTKEAVKNIDCIIIIASLHQNEIFEFLTKDLNFGGKIYGTYPKISKLQ